MLNFPQSQDLQNKMENAGGDELKQKKALVGKLQTVLQFMPPSRIFLFLLCFFFHVLKPLFTL